VCGYSSGILSQILSHKAIFKAVKLKWHRLSLPHVLESVPISMSFLMVVKFAVMSVLSELIL
jgi:hypothetical protein